MTCVPLGHARISDPVACMLLASPAIFSLKIFPASSSKWFEEVARYQRTDMTNGGDVAGDGALLAAFSVLLVGDHTVR